MMVWYEILSLVLNLLLGGGLLVTLLTLRSTRKMADEQAKGAELDNDSKASSTLMEYVVKPLKVEMTSLRREITRFRNAIERIPECQYSTECPVKDSLKNSEDHEEIANDDYQS